MLVNRDWPDLVESFGPYPLTRLDVERDQSHATAVAWERVFRTFSGLLEELHPTPGTHMTASNVTDVFPGLYATSAAPVPCPRIRVSCHQHSREMSGEKNTKSSAGNSNFQGRSRVDQDIWVSRCDIASVNMPSFEELLPQSPSVRTSPSTETHILLDRISQKLTGLDIEEKKLIKAIARRRVGLKRLWNSALPVHQLPDELLIQIFTDFRDAGPYPYIVPPMKYHRMGWQGLMLPCAVLHVTAALQEPAFDGDSPSDAVSISMMLPPNPSATLPALATATEIKMLIKGVAYEIFAVSPLCIAALKNTPALLAKRACAFYLDATDDTQWDRFITQGLGDLVRCFGHSPLTSLTVEADHSNATAAAWERVFRTFPLLEELAIKGSDDVSTFVLGLHAASSAQHSPVACTNLKKISLEGLGPVATYEAMRKCFQHRADGGVARLEILDLVYLSSEVAGEALRRFIEDLHEAVECVRVRNSG
ncbi:hypothetical protein LXA43DRAFT_1185644 [Ganoderma leucocontextum]|nr:hypothetical protein LXA43DRAFT_1185644 [Ganoderma leucocontextum]